MGAALRTPDLLPTKSEDLGFSGPSPLPASSSPRILQTERTEETRNSRGRGVCLWGRGQVFLHQPEHVDWEISFLFSQKTDSSLRTQHNYLLL